MEQSTIATNEAYLYNEESSSSEMNASIYFPKVKFQIKRRNYTVKTASTLKEYKQAFKLRFDVFYGEMQDLGNNIEGFDCDIFEWLGHSLLSFLSAVLLDGFFQNFTNVAAWRFVA